MGMYGLCKELFKVEVAQAIRTSTRRVIKDLVDEIVVDVPELRKFYKGAHTDGYGGKVHSKTVVMKQIKGEMT